MTRCGLRLAGPVQEAAFCAEVAQRPGAEETITVHPPVGDTVWSPEAAETVVPWRCPAGAGLRPQRHALGSGAPRRALDGRSRPARRRAGRDAMTEPRIHWTLRARRPADFSVVEKTHATEAEADKSVCRHHAQGCEVVVHAVATQQLADWKQPRKEEGA